MRRWKSQSSFGRWFGLVILLAVIGGTVSLALRLAQRLNGSPANWPIDLQLYGEVLLLLGLIILSGALFYRVAASLTLGYELDRNGLYITWLGNRAVVPLDQIESIDIGLRGHRLPWQAVQGISYYWGQGRTAEGKLLHLFATRAPAQCLVIHTPDAVYAISPADTDAFVQDLEQRRNLGTTKQMASTVQPSRMFLYAFWNDSTVRILLVTAFALNMLILALLAARYPTLAATVEMHFTSAGQVSELRPRHEVLFLPLAAFGLSLLNTAVGLLFYQSQQLGARLLQGASVLVQVLFGVAVITIIG